MPLLRFALRRFLATIVVVVTIVTIVFFLAHASPYDPIKLVLGQHAADPRTVAVLRQDFGLDKPLLEQYTTYLGGVLHGQLGYSEEQDTFGEPVTYLIGAGMPVSFKLGLYALVLSLLVGLPVGLLSAVRQNSWFDHAGQGTMMILYALPTFVIAPICQLIFGVQLRWLPVSGWGDSGLLGYKEMVLPVSLYAAGLAGYFAKSFRSFMLEVLRQDYIRTARAKGLQERLVVYVHAFKNTLLGLASIVGPTIAFLIVGAFIIETYFGIPGIGLITATAITQSDYPMIEGTTIILATFVVFVNALTDVFYALVDPRVRL